MYSVLIGNQKTLDSFEQHSALFMDVLNRHDLDICRWNENGDTVKTAVPELYSLIADKQEWRAIIVCAEDGGLMEGFPASEENPYDFLEPYGVPSEKEGSPLTGPSLSESRIPLIRLTQMLGGVPVPKTEFNPKTIEERGKAVRVVYEPEQEETAEPKRLAYEKLVNKYKLHAKAPEEILLFTYRRKEPNRRENIARAWTDPKEQESSEFWARNGYPSICRFLFLDSNDLGQAEQVRESFSLWVSVMIAATNDIDASTLQAYRLMRVEPEYDPEKFSDAVQSSLNRLLGVRNFIEKQKEKRRAARYEESMEAPHYELSDIPVEIPVSARNLRSDGKKKFSLVSESRLKDKEQWDTICIQAQKDFRTIEKSAARSLDLAADLMRSDCRYRERDVMPLTDYQSEVMKDQLKGQYMAFFHKRSLLPLMDDINYKEMRELENQISRKISKRITKKESWILFGISFGLLALFTLPALVMMKMALWGSLRAFIAMLLLEAAVTGTTELVVLLMQNAELKALLQQYSVILTQIKTKIQENASLYSEYITNIGSYMHGSTYLTWLHRRKARQIDYTNIYEDHLHAISSTIQSFSVWERAFGLDVSMNIPLLPEVTTADLTVPPSRNTLYVIGSGSGREYEVPLNRSGDTVRVPFDFISCFRIVREELYND